MLYTIEKDENNLNGIPMQRRELTHTHTQLLSSEEYCIEKTRTGCCEHSHQRARKSPWKLKTGKTSLKILYRGKGRLQILIKMIFSSQ